MKKSRRFSLLLLLISSLALHRSASAAPGLTLVKEIDLNAIRNRRLNLKAGAPFTVGGKSVWMGANPEIGWVKSAKGREIFIQEETKDASFFSVEDLQVPQFFSIGTQRYSLQLRPYLRDRGPIEAVLVLTNVNDPKDERTLFHKDLMRAAGPAVLAAAGENVVVNGHTYHVFLNEDATSGARMFAFVQIMKDGTVNVFSIHSKSVLFSGPPACFEASYGDILHRTTNYFCLEQNDTHLKVFRRP